MDDHPQRQVHLPHPSSSSRHDHQPHHPHFQAHYRHQQDIHGPLSASVVEGRRAFPFHSSLRSTPLSFSTPAPPSANLSVADILDKYQDANSDFLVSILNAKAKEDEVYCPFSPAPLCAQMTLWIPHIPLSFFFFGQRYKML